MKGSELIDRWKSACRLVESRRSVPCDPVGSRIRDIYDVDYNGCSVCAFRDKKYDLVFNASCSDHPWQVNPFVRIGPEYRKGTISIKDIVPEAEYEVREFLSVAEQFERGDLRPECFRVRDESCRSVSMQCWVNTFEEADAIARKWAKEELDRCNRDQSWSCHTPGRIVNDVQAAREIGEIRHYEYFHYGYGHYNWVSVCAASRSEFIRVGCG